MLCIDQSPSLLPSISIFSSNNTKLYARSCSDSQLVLVDTWSIGLNILQTLDALDGLIIQLI